MDVNSLPDIDPKLFAQATKDVDAELNADQARADELRLKAQEDRTDSSGILPDVIQRTFNSAANGLSKAVIETKDFVVGEPEEHEKSEFRKNVEGTDRALKRRSAGYGLVSGVTQFAVGMVGAGKLLKPLKVASKAGIAGKEVLRGAVAGGVVLDPHEDRLSNLIQQYPALANPVTAYLASDPTDSSAEGRLKNMLEGIVIDAALIGTLIGSVKTLKALRAGDTNAAVKASSEAAKKAAQLGDGGGVKPNGASTVPPSPGQADLAPKIERVNTPTAGTKDTVKVPKAIDPLDPVSVAKVVNDSSDDVAAILKYGSREDAALNGHTFKGTGRIPIEAIRGSDEVRVLMDNATETFKAEFDKAKGGAVFSDKRLNQLAASRGKIFNEDPEVFFGVLAKNAKDSNSIVANMQAGLNISAKMFDDVYDVAFKIENGMLDEWGGIAAKADAEMVDRLTAAVEAYANSKAILSGFGKGLRRGRSEFRPSAAQLEKFKTMNPEQVRKALYSTGGDLSKMPNVMNEGFWTRVLGEAQFSLTNSLLWLYPTHLVNLTSNTYQLGARPTQKLLGSFVMGGKGSVVRREALQEYKYTIASMGDAWSNALDAMKRGDSIIDPHSAEFFAANRGPNAAAAPGAVEFKEVRSITDVAETLFKAVNYRNLVGLPTRALGASDEFFKQARYRAYVQAKASVEADSLELVGKEASDYVASKLRNAFDEAGLAIDPVALKEAQVTTYTQDLLPGTFGKDVVQNSRSNYQPLALILPFVKTPVNVLRAGHKLTPGLNLLQVEYRKMISGAAGPEAQADAIGQMMLGSVFMGITANMALEGRITGGGPTNLKLKKELMATGWKPYSWVYNHADGSKTYVPMGRLDPVAMPFSIMADLVDMLIVNPQAHETNEWQEAAGASAVAIMKNFSEKTFLLNVNQMMRALSDPETNLTKFVGSTAGNIIPGSSAIRGYVNQDEYLRDARGLVENAFKNLPVYSETLPPQRDAFGEPIQRRIGLTTRSKPDVVQEEHNRIILETGEGIGKMAPTRNGVDLRDLKLEDGSNAYDKLQEKVSTIKLGGRSLKQVLERSITSKKYQKLVDGESSVKGTKMFLISGIVSKFRESAYKRLLRESKVLRSEMQKRKLEVRSLFNAKNSTQETQTKELLNALGIE